MKSKTNNGVDYTEELKFLVLNDDLPLVEIASAFRTVGELEDYLNEFNFNRTDKNNIDTLIKKLKFKIRRALKHLEENQVDIAI